MRTPRVRAAGLAIDICTWLCSCRAKYRSRLPHASQVALSGSSATKSWSKASRHMQSKFPWPCVCSLGAAKAHD